MKRRNRKADAFPNLFPEQDGLNEAAADTALPEAEAEQPKAEEGAVTENVPSAENGGIAQQTEEGAAAQQTEQTEQPEQAQPAPEQPEQEQPEEELAQVPSETEQEGQAEQEGQVQPEQDTASAEGEEHVIREGEGSEGEEEGKKRRRGKIKEPMPRKKKIIIGVIAGILAVAVLAAVIVPVAIFFTNNHTVSSAEDLLAVDWQKLGDKKVYLQKDIAVEGDLEIPASAVINLNKHSLTVNGALKVTGDVQIGTVSGDSFNEKGALSVTALQVTSENGGIQLYSDAVIGEGVVNAAVFRTARSLTINGTLTVNAVNAYIEGAVSGAEGAQLIFNGGRADVTGEVNTAMQSVSGAYLNVDGVAADITADENSYVVLSGKAASVTGGKGVLALKNFDCSAFTDMKKLGIFVQSCAGDERIEGVEDVFFIEKLDAPSAAQVNMRGDKLILTISDVEHAELADFSYRVTVGEEVFHEVKGTELDITSAVTSAGVYDILIVAQGNFKPGEDGRYDIDSFDKHMYYIDSYPCGIRYEHTFTLDTPANLSVTQVEGGIEVNFDPVAFADGYDVYINGAEQPVHFDKNEAFISSELLSAGSNAIYVQAVSNNEQINASSRALIGYVKYEKLATPAVSAPVVSGREVAVEWTKTENSPARMFEVVFTYNSAQSGEASKTVYTSANTVTVLLEDMAEGSDVSVSVRALGYGYYKTGDAGTSSVEAGGK